MHYRLLVTFDKENASNSQEAREYAYNELSEDGSFVGEGGRFNSPISDWFVIGGRWSGELQSKLLKENFFDTVHKEIPSKHNFGYSTDELKENNEKIQKIWERLGGKGENPYNRDTYEHYGYEDDAMLLTQELYDFLLKEYLEDEDSGEYANEGDHVFSNESWGRGYLKFVDLDYDNLSPDMIGKKWIVVVDYHS